MNSMWSCSHEESYEISHGQDIERMDLDQAVEDLYNQLSANEVNNIARNYKIETEQLCNCYCYYNSTDVVQQPSQPDISVRILLSYSYVTMLMGLIAKGLMFKSCSSGTMLWNSENDISLVQINGKRPFLVVVTEEKNLICLRQEIVVNLLGENSQVMMVSEKNKGIWVPHT